MSKNKITGRNILEEALRGCCAAYCLQYPRYEGMIDLGDDYRQHMKRLVKRSKNPLFQCLYALQRHTKEIVIAALIALLLVAVFAVKGLLPIIFSDQEDSSSDNIFLPEETTPSALASVSTTEQAPPEELTTTESTEATSTDTTEEMTTTEFTEDTTTEIPSGEIIEPPVYEDLFESFMRFPSSNQYFLGKATLEKYQTEGSSIVLFRVIGMEEKYVGDFMIYLVQIVDVYGIKNYDTEKVYRMAWRGHLEEHLYGRPPLEIGKIYGRLMALNEGDLEIYNLWQAGLIYDVKEENGKRYLYAYGTDLSQYHCRIPITDPEENSIYKPGKHDKAIAKLNELGQPLPTFDYKVEAEEFYEELN